MNLYLCAALATLAAGQAAPPPESPAIVEGRVVFAATGEPIRKAHVSLGSTNEDNFELVATTDEAGHFRFVEVGPGSYKLLADKGGFLPGTYGQVEHEDPESLLKVSAGDQVRNIVLRVFPASAISGRILDSDGDPIPGHEVVLWIRRSRKKNAQIQTTNQTTTDHDGQYRFGGLLPGTYYVSSDPANDNSPAASIRQVFVDSSGKPTNLHDYRTFFPSSLSLDAAQSLHLLSGQERSGVDIHELRGPLLSVAGKVSEAPQPISDYRVSASVDVGMGWTAEDGRLSVDGSFLIANLPPGKHRLTLLRQGTSGLQTVGSTQMELTSQNITGVMITKFEPATVRVRVTMEDDPKPLTMGSVFLESIAKGGNPHVSQYEFAPQDGTYVVNHVSPGKYKVGFTNVSQCFLKSVRSDGHELDPRSIEVAGGANIDLVLTYSKNVGAITGDVDVPDDRPKKHVHIFVLQEDESHEHTPWRVEADQSLHFSIENRPPGKYIAFAAEDGDWNLWEESNFIRVIRSEGTEIDLHEKEHATLRLKLITTEVTNRARQQLGL